MNTKQAREYGKKAVIFEKYIYEITSEGCDDVFIGSECEEVQTALMSFGEGVDPDTVLGLYTLDGGEEGMLFTTDGIVSYFPSVEETDSMFSDDDDDDEEDDDDEDDVQYDYCFSFRYSDVKSTGTWDYTEKKRMRKTPDCELTLEIDLKDGREINFDYSMFDKTPMKEFIDEMLEFEKKLHPEEEPEQKKKPVVSGLTSIPKDEDSRAKEVKVQPRSEVSQSSENGFTRFEYQVKLKMLQKHLSERYGFPSWDLINEMLSDGGFKEAGSAEVKEAIESIGAETDTETILGLYSNTYEDIDNKQLYGTEVLFTTKSYTVIDVNRGKRTVSCSFDYSDIADVRERTKKYERKFRGKYGPTYYTVVYVSLNDGREIDFHEPISGTAEYIKQMADFEKVL